MRVCMCICWSLGCVQLFVTPWIVAHQAPLSMEFSRQAYWSGLPFPSPWDLPDPGIEPGAPALQATREAQIGYILIQNKKCIKKISCTWEQDISCSPVPGTVSYNQHSPTSQKTEHAAPLGNIIPVQSSGWEKQPWWLTFKSCFLMRMHQNH